MVAKADLCEDDREALLKSLEESNEEFERGEHTDGFEFVAFETVVQLWVSEVGVRGE